MAYPKVTILNLCGLRAKGTVGYLSWFCSDDNYSVDPNNTWEAPGRGTCLVTKITAMVGDIFAKPYESSGTSYSKFAIIKLPDGSYMVTRLTTGSEDKPPEDYTEPTEKQK
jgi:hypothetical protein